MDGVVLMNLFIKMKDPEDDAIRQEIIESLQDSISDGSIQVHDQYALKQVSQTSLALIDAIFYIIIAIMMFLCFFALQGAMSANLYEQSKEIGILRALGYTKYRICALYFYEALLLVLASCLLGIVIGVIVGITMVMQQDLFLGTSYSFFFPWK